MANTVWFVTSDNMWEYDALSATTFFVYKWDGSNFTLIDSSSIIDSNSWDEPQIDLKSRNGISVIATQWQQKSGITHMPEIRVYDGETLLRTVYLDQIGGLGVAGLSPQEGGSKWLVIDDAGNIHVLARIVNTARTYDYISADNGATWNLVQIYQDLNGDAPSWLVKDSAGNLYVTNSLATEAYKSTNNGTTWSLNGAPPANTLIFDLVNDTFFAVVDTGSAWQLFKSTDLTNWGSSLLTMPGAYANAVGATFAHDGTYYYLIYISNVAGMGTQTVYRSSDAVSWTEVGSFTAVQTVGGVAQLLVADDGTLYFTDYYNETNGTNHFMTFWYSTDQGANWTAVPTPFWDANAGSSPGGNPPYVPWYSCPQGILLPTAAADSASLSPSLSPSSSPSISQSLSPSSSVSISPSMSPSFPYTVINPKVMLQWSDDGANTWSNEYWRDPGKIGEFRTRLRWLRLGYAKDRVFKIAVSDPCKWVFLDAWIDVEEGTRR